MRKSPSAFRTISEVGEVLAIPAHVLRFWESKFIQIKPVKRGGGRRYYRPEDIGLIRGIQHLLHEKGMTIKGAQKILRERGVKAIVAMGRDLLDNAYIPPETNKPAATPKQTPLEAIYASLIRLQKSIETQIAELA